MMQKYSLLEGMDFSASEEDIDYSKLRERLVQFYKEGSCIFDVSAARKLYLSDILAIAVVEKFNNVYTFDLKKTPNFDEPWEMLFHALEQDNKGYNYSLLTATPIFEKCSQSILILQAP